MISSYDPQHRLLTGTTLGSVEDGHSYNAFDELENYAATFGSTPLHSVSYAGDAVGRITEKTETIDGVTTVYGYGYDLAGRLVEVTEDGLLVSEYTYDDNGNRLTHTTSAGTTTGTYDAQDRLETYGDLTFTYNDYGQLETRTDTASGQTTSYVYDPLGNLRSVTLPNGTLIEYLVDGQNRRVQKRIDGAVVQQLIYRNSLQPIAELDGAGNVVARFICGGSCGTGNVPDYMVKGGNSYRFVTDHLGSVRLVVDVATGVIVQVMTYDEFGRVLSDTNPGFQPFGFAGGLWDADTGLVRFGARDYDPEAGRWTAKDPMRFAGGDTNLYGYVLSDPVNGFDPAGRTGFGMSGALECIGCLPPVSPPLFDLFDDFCSLPGTQFSAICTGFALVGLFADDGDQCDRKSELDRCYKAAKGSFNDWKDFCATLPTKEMTAVCRAKQFASKTEKRNLCYHFFGD